MYRKDKTIIVFLVILVITVTYFYDFCMESSFLSGAMAWGGIVFGFLITSISTLFGTNFVKHLNEREDHDQAIHKTQLQILKEYFNATALSCLFTTSLALMALIFPNVKVLFQILFAVIVVDVYLTWKIVKLLLKALEEEAKNK